MNAEHVSKPVLTGDTGGPLPVVGAARTHHHVRNACSAGARDHLHKIGLEGRRLQMAVRVDESLQGQASLMTPASSLRMRSQRPQVLRRA